MCGSKPVWFGSLCYMTWGVLLNTLSISRNAHYVTSPFSIASCVCIIHGALQCLCTYLVDRQIDIDVGYIPHCLIQDLPGQQFVIVQQILTYLISCIIASIIAAWISIFTASKTHIDCVFQVSSAVKITFSPG